MIGKNEFSIVIPTHNRPKYLFRILSYYNNHNVECKIFVADSSGEEFKKLNRRIITSFMNLNIVHLDHYSSNNTIFHKLLDTFSHIDTEYTITCAD
ncbi:MAG: TIGR00180 family glycosyltransferase, partial [Candidatus Odinarchaeota archaeon]